MRKALGYARVSGRTQALDGTGLQEQRAQCEAWAARNGYEIVQWFEDTITGETPWDKRPAMRALVERVAVNGIDAVIVHQLDRVARGKSGIFEDFFQIVAESGVQVISTIDGILTDDPQGDEFKSADAEMIRSIKQAIIRQEKRKLVARMTLGKLRAKAAGVKVDGKYAYGADPNKPNELVTLARMRELRDSGLTIYRVCKMLNAEGLRPRTAESWKPNVVAAILERSKSNGA